MRRSDPLENLNSYIMVHGGVDRHERLLEVEWVKDVFKAARAIGEMVDPSPEQLDPAIDHLRRELRRDPIGGDSDTASRDLSGDEE